MLPQSEVIRAIVLEESPCCGTWSTTDHGQVTLPKPEKPGAPAGKARAPGHSPVEVPLEDAAPAHSP